MLKKKSPYLVLILFVLIFELFVYSTKEETNAAAEVHDKHKISSFELNHTIDFCGEKVPLHSQDILERYEREVLKNGHWHSEMILMHKRSGKYFPMIEKMLSEYGIPQDFKYLCIIESGLDNVVSPVGAAGFWQIMEKTGQEFGLKVTKHIDERYHLEKATKVACKYIKAAYKKFGSWTLAAASYNMGVNGLSRRLKKQKVNNYYDLLLNRETSRYVFRLLAVKEIFNDPSRFNFNFPKSEQYKEVPTKIVTVDSTLTNLSEWSEEQGINYKILKLFNPWLRTNRLPNSDSTLYKIKVPTDLIYTFSNDTTQTDQGKELEKQIDEKQ